MAITTTITTLSVRSISPQDVKPDGRYTTPRSFGVYELPSSVSGTPRFRFGNHPVRRHELEREFGSCELMHLFLERTDAVAMAAALNKRKL